jgi:hypothetical protein
MDLMYGSGGDYDLSLQEMIEGDLKSGNECLGKMSYSTNMDDFLDMQMHDFNSAANGGGGSLFGEDGFEEFGMHFDSRINSDDYGFLDSLTGGDVVSVTSSNHFNSQQNQNRVGLLKSSSSGVGPTTTSLNLNSSLKKMSGGGGSTSSNGGIVGSGGGGNVGIVNITRNNPSSRQSVHKSSSSSTTPSVYVTSWSSLLNRSDVSKVISFEESCGIMVSPAGRGFRKLLIILLHIALCFAAACIF